MMKWNEMLSNKNNAQKIEQFAIGNLSRRDVERVTGMRSFVRERGTAEARRVTRKALRRRGILS